MNTEMTVTAIKQMHDMEKGLIQQVTLFEQKSVESLNKQAIAFDSKVKDIKQNFALALDQLLSGNSSDSDANVNNIVGYCKQMKSSTATASTELVQIIDTNNQKSCETLNTIVKGIETQTNSIESSVKTVSWKNQQATDHLKLIGDSVMTRKNNLDETVRNVVSHVKSEITANCETVKQTSKTASNLYSQIQNITGTMEKSSSDALINFTGLLAGEGMMLENDLKSHFTVTNEFITTQQSDVVPNMISQVESYSSSLDHMNVSPTGTTPTKKQAYQIITQLPNTRAHDIIKHEVLSGIWQMPEQFYVPANVICKSNSVSDVRVSDISSISNDASTTNEDTAIDEDALSVHSTASSLGSSKQSKRKFGTINHNGGNIVAKPTVESAVSKVAKVQEVETSLVTPDAENVCIADEITVPAVVVASSSAPGLRRPSKIGTTRKASVTSVR